MTAAADLVFLPEVDNTLPDNDCVQDDLRTHLEREFGPGYHQHHSRREKGAVAGAEAQ
jgi:hypothetical protein